MLGGDHRNRFDNTGGISFGSHEDGIIANMISNRPSRGSGNYSGGRPQRRERQPVQRQQRAANSHGNNNNSYGNNNNSYGNNNQW